MQVIEKNIDELVEYANNARINDKAVAPVAESIRAFGFKQPIVIDGSNVIIAGHTRLKAAKQLGLKTVPCVVADDLTEEQVKAYRLLDNKTNEFSEWDLTKLAIELPTIDFGGMGIDMNIIDFKLPEVKEEKAKEAPPPPVMLEEILNHMREVDLIAVQFSGGKDSVCVLNWAMEAAKQLDKKIVACFIETGAEYPCVTAHVIETCDRLGVPLEILNPKQHLLQYYTEKKAFPNVIYRDCMFKFIHDVTDEYLCSREESFVLLRGGRKDQKTGLSKSREVFEKTHKGRTFKILSPFYAFTAEQYQAELEKVKDFMWHGYAKGFVRTACWMCPFQTEEQFAALKKHYPVLWEKMKSYVHEWDYLDVGNDPYRKRMDAAFKITTETK